MTRSETPMPDDLITNVPLARTVRRARWTFLGPWTFCDDDGSYHDDADVVRETVWPTSDGITTAEVAGHIADLEAQGIVCRYRDRNQRRLHLTGWWEGRVTPRRGECCHLVHP